jgi:ankyrin repeat protein
VITIMSSLDQLNEQLKKLEAKKEKLMLQKKVQEEVQQLQELLAARTINYAEVLKLLNDPNQKSLRIKLVEITRQEHKDNILMRAIDERLPVVVGGILTKFTKNRQQWTPANVNCSLPFDFGNSRTPFGYKGRYKVSPLHLALHKNGNTGGDKGKKERNIEIITKIFGASPKPDFDKEDEHGVPPIYYCITSGSLEMMLDKADLLKPLQGNAKIRPGTTYLHYLASQNTEAENYDSFTNNRYRLQKLLNYMDLNLNEIFDIDVQDGDGNTPLMVAKHMYHTRLLLDVESNSTIVNNLGDNVLHCSVHKLDKMRELVKLVDKTLLDEPNAKGKTPLELAAIFAGLAEGDSEIAEPLRRGEVCRILIESGANQLVTSKWLPIAIEYRWIDFSTAPAFDFDYNERSVNGKTSFCRLIAKGDILINVLMDTAQESKFRIKIDPNLPEIDPFDGDKVIGFPLLYCIKSGGEYRANDAAVYYINQLLRSSTPVNINQQTHDGKTALVYAILSNHREVVGLLQQRGADSSILVDNPTTLEPEPLLHFALKNERSADIIEQLVFDDGIKGQINLPLGARGLTPLILAMEYGGNQERMRRVQILLDAGADPNLALTDGTTPLNATDNRDIKELLIQKGAQVSPLDEINEIDELMRNDNSGQARELLFGLMRRENFVTDYLNLQNNRGNTVLMLILARFRMGRRNNISRMVDKLLEFDDIQVDLKNDQGDTALHIAARTGYCFYEGWNQLLLTTFDKNATNNQGETAAQIAANLQWQLINDNYNGRRDGPPIADVINNFESLSVQQQRINQEECGFFRVAQCPKCGYGPIKNQQCEDMQTHRNESPIGNGCEHCGYFSRQWHVFPTVEDWRRAQTQQGRRFNPDQTVDPVGYGHVVWDAKYPEEKEYTYVGRKTLWVRRGSRNGEPYYRQEGEVVQVPTGSGKDLYPGTIVELKNYLKPGRPYSQTERSRAPNDAYFTGAYKAAIEQAAIQDDCLYVEGIIKKPTILLNKTGENQFVVVKGLFDYNTIKTLREASIRCLDDTTETEFTHFMILSRRQFESLNCANQNCVTGVQYGEEGWTVRGTVNKRQRENDDEAGRAAQRQRTSLSSRMSTLTLKF